MPLLYRLLKSIDTYTAVQNFQQSIHLQHGQRENRHAWLLIYIDVKITGFKRRHCLRAEFTGLHGYYVSVLSELGVTRGIVSSLKILLSWYFDNMIRLIISAECAVWPFMLHRM